MSSMVSEYIIRPALQQVRRFSRSSTTSESESTPVITHTKPKERPSSRDDAISETEEDSYLKDEEHGSVASPTSSQSSVMPIFDNEPINLSFQRLSEPPVSENDPPLPSRDTPEDSVASQPTLPAAQGAVVQQLGMVEDPLARLNNNRVNEPAALELMDTVHLAADPRSPLPEDDGMGALRKRILDIQALQLTASEKARLMHLLLMESYAKSRIGIPSDRPFSPSSVASWEQKGPQGRLDSFKFWQDLLGDTTATQRFVLTREDITPTFAPLKLDEEDSEYRALGCEHYQRNVKSQCSTCERWYTCRFCHDKVEEHAMIAKDTKHMLCMFCGEAQKAGEACVSCGESAAVYYCSICKLWNNDHDKSIYHCNDCGICRIGRGLGKDFFHCKKCNACLGISLENDHRCIERLLDCDCPICGEYMFNSPRGVCNMKCGHALHRDCWTEHIKHAYKCPICNKSIVNMETQFRNLDIAIETQPMPTKFQDTLAVVLCNDCSGKTTVKYHWLGLKCAVCQSYNTSQLQILGVDAHALDIAAVAVSDSQLPEPTGTGMADILHGTQTPSARDIPRRRRHSSNLVQLNTEILELGSHTFGSYVVQDRLARSVSPVVPGHQLDTEDSETEDDIIGFWSRVPRSITSNEDPDEECDSDEDSVSSIGDDSEEDDDDDEDEINIFGHR